MENKASPGSHLYFRPQIGSSLIKTLIASREITNCGC